MLRGPGIRATIRRSRVLGTVQRTPSRDDKQRFKIRSPIVTSANINTSVNRLCTTTENINIGRQLHVLVSLSTTETGDVKRLTRLLSSRNIKLALRNNNIAFVSETANHEFHNTHLNPTCSLSTLNVQLSSNKDVLRLAFGGHLITTIGSHFMDI